MSGLVFLLLKAPPVFLDITFSSNSCPRKPGAWKFLEGLRSRDNPIRITDTPRWKEKHHELPETAWSDPRIAFKEECEVCHTDAKHGNYDDDDSVRVPGPNGTWRRWEDD